MQTQKMMELCALVHTLTLRGQYFADAQDLRNSFLCLNSDMPKCCSRWYSSR